MDKSVYSYVYIYIWIYNVFPNFLLLRIPPLVGLSWLHKIRSTSAIDILGMSWWRLIEESQVHPTFPEKSQPPTWWRRLPQPRLQLFVRTSCALAGREPRSLSPRTVQSRHVRTHADRAEWRIEIPRPRKDLTATALPSRSYLMIGQSSAVHGCTSQIWWFPYFKADYNL